MSSLADTPQPAGRLWELPLPFLYLKISLKIRELVIAFNFVYVFSMYILTPLLGYNALL